MIVATAIADCAALLGAIASWRTIEASTHSDKQDRARRRAELRAKAKR